MLIVITLDVTNDPDEYGVQLAGISPSLIDSAIEQVNYLGLKSNRLLVTGISTKIKGG